MNLVECQPSTLGVLALITSRKPAVVVHGPNPSTWEVEAGRSGVQLHSEFEASLDYMTTWAEWGGRMRNFLETPFKRQDFRSHHLADGAFSARVSVEGRLFWEHLSTPDTSAGD